jgi:hypothetical protein
VTVIERDQLLDDLDEAAVRMRAARDRMERVSRDSPQFQIESLRYLHAVVSHMSIVSVAQAKQHQDLAEAFDGLQDEVNDLRSRLAAITRPQSALRH